MSANWPKTWLLEIADLEVCYRHTQVLFGLSLRIEPGQFVTLLGRNGMGKSTIIKSIVGMLAPKAGTIHFDYTVTTGKPSYEVAREGIGLVPEGRRIFPTLTVHENLVAFAANRRNIKSPWTAERVYQTFPRLKERSRALGRTLSGGEQQMLAIGRALITNPRLLILDEATEGLAPIASDEIWTSLAFLKREGLSILTVDKNLRPLLSLADKHFIVEKGRIVWEGTSTAFTAQEERLQTYLSI
jgi:branched-chain amino acid transport system ATP-binding protein